eukprot:TRINITY_DN11866_c0_g2_i1.p1 TRINITY_DN11866_c0_g2~~TRINITY_DN11866_c0_g2_i1.p1  ORF type:complete len:986 (-),score=265.15 TRINITY_DN11866_c0_g2_i1:256-3213(-)
MELSVFPWIQRKATVGDKATLKTKETIVKEYGIPRRLIRSYLAEEVEESEACFSLPFTLLLVVSYAIFAVLHNNASQVRAVEDSMAEMFLNGADFATVDLFEDDELDGEGLKDVFEVSSIVDFWSWMHNGFLPLFNNEDSDDRGLYMNYNRLVGGIRLSQERSGEGEEAAACPSLAAGDLKKFYAMPCVHGRGFELEPEMWSARFTSNKVRVERFYLYQDSVEVLNQAWELERRDWFDRNTRKLEIAFPVYNAEFGIHTIMHINFFLNRGGHIWVMIIPLSVYATWHPKWYYWFIDCVWIACVLWMIATEMNHIMAVLKRSGSKGLFNEYLTLWNLCDWVSVACAIAVMIMFGVALDMTNEVNDRMQAIPPEDSAKEDPGSYSAAVDNYLRALEECVHQGYRLRLVLFMYPFVIIVRLFKAYGSQPRLALITSTIWSARKDLFHFFVIFFSVYLSFAISGSIFFGRAVQAFGSFDRSLTSCFRILLGDLMWDELRQIGVWEAASWLTLYIILVVMVLLNMLLAIIMDHYMTNKLLSENKETLVQETIKLWKRSRAERAGAQPLGKILDAFMREDHQRALEALEGNDGEAVAELDEDEEDENNIVFPEDLQKSYIEGFKDKGLNMNLEQAIEVLASALAKYYDAHHQANNILEEAMMVTRKINYRTQKIVKVAELQTTVVRSHNELESLKDLVDEMHGFTMELRQEQEAQQKEVEQLRYYKKGLLLQLQQKLNIPSQAMMLELMASAGGHARRAQAPHWRLGKFAEGDVNEEEHERGRNLERAFLGIDDGGSPGPAFTEPSPMAGYNSFMTGEGDEDYAIVAVPDVEPGAGVGGFLLPADGPGSNATSPQAPPGAQNSLEQRAAALSQRIASMQSRMEPARPPGSAPPLAPPVAGSQPLTMAGGDDSVPSPPGGPGTGLPPNPMAEFQIDAEDAGPRAPLTSMRPKPASADPLRAPGVGSNWQTTPPQPPSRLAGASEAPRPRTDV